MNSIWELYHTSMPHWLHRAQLTEQNPDVIDALCRNVLVALLLVLYDMCILDLLKRVEV